MGTALMPALQGVVTIRTNIWKATIQDLMCSIWQLAAIIIISSRLNLAPSPLHPLLNKADVRAGEISRASVFREANTIRADLFHLSNVSQKDKWLDHSHKEKILHLLITKSIYLPVTGGLHFVFPLVSMETEPLLFSKVILPTYAVGPVPLSYSGLLLWSPSPSHM